MSVQVAIPDQEYIELVRSCASWEPSEFEICTKR
jgi:hypothetical protein